MFVTFLLLFIIIYLGFLYVFIYAYLFSILPKGIKQFFLCNITTLLMNKNNQVGYLISCLLDILKLIIKAAE